MLDMNSQTATELQDFGNAMPFQNRRYFSNYVSYHFYIPKQAPAEIY
jgi:hypothetical protein